MCARVPSLFYLHVRKSPPRHVSHPGGEIDLIGACRSLCFATVCDARRIKRRLKDVCVGLWMLCWRARALLSIPLFFFSTRLRGLH